MGKIEQVYYGVWEENMDIAIVLGSKGVNATGLIRSLGMASINVVYASTYSKIESKYVWKYLKLPEDKKSG